MYALRNTNKLSWDIIIWLTKYGIVLVINDMASAKSDVNGPNKKYVFCVF